MGLELPAKLSPAVACTVETRHRYRLFDLAVESFRPLPEMALATTAVDPDLRIEPEDASSFTHLRGAEPGMRVSSHPDCFSAWIPTIGGMRVTPGRVGVFLADDTGWEQMRPYLLGTGLAAALYQLGMQPHHVSAVDIGGRAVAFTGPSGAGKSTLAYEWMRQFGARLVSDDLARIEALGNAAAQIYPGLARVKLWRDALVAFSSSTQGLSQELQGRDKFFIENITTGAEPLPLAALVLIDSDPALEAPLIERLTGARKAMEWRSSLYRPEFAGLLLTESVLATHLMALSAAVPVYLLTRSWHLDQLSVDALCLRNRLSADGLLFD